MERSFWIAPTLATCLLACAASPLGEDASDSASPPADAARHPKKHADSGAPGADGGTQPETGAEAGAPTPDAAPDAVPDAAPDAVADVVEAGTTLDLHEAMVFDNPANLADWPVTTTITEVDFQYMGMDGVHVEFSKRDGPGSWPPVTPPGWTGPLEYTLGFAEYIGGQWYASAAIQFWPGLPAAGGNVADDTVTGAQCTAFGYGSTCQVAANWYYDGRWGALQGYQPATGEMIGVFVVAGNVRGVTDGSESPVQERSNVVLVPMPTSAGASYTF